jgi:hypothetical protein
VEANERIDHPKVTFRIRDSIESLVAWGTNTQSQAIVFPEDMARDSDANAPYLCAKYNVVRRLIGGPPKLQQRRNTYAITAIFGSNTETVAGPQRDTVHARIGALLSFCTACFNGANNENEEPDDKYCAAFHSLSLFEASTIVEVWRF